MDHWQDDVRAMSELELLSAGIFLLLDLLLRAFLGGFGPAYLTCNRGLSRKLLGARVPAIPQLGRRPSTLSLVSTLPAGPLTQVVVFTGLRPGNGRSPPQYCSGQKQDGERGGGRLSPERVLGTVPVA